MDSESRWQPAMPLPCELTVEVTVPGFRVADFVGLRRGSIVATRWNVARNVPVRANGILIAWGELEGSAKNLAVRLTELA